MRFIVAAILLALGIAGCVSSPDVPEWRGKASGTAYLGDDVLWRPREWLIFNMLDDKGTGFKLKFTVRDMNTYVHAPAPVLFRVVAPDGRIVAGKFLEDDGITGGNFKYQDGIYDPFADFRYRQWHRVNSPEGMPANKKRSPYLSHPEKLPFRTAELSVPAAGKGLYRVLVVGRWDHWISITPNRPIMTGVHPGAGPLYVHGTILDKSFFYVPKSAEDIGLATTEEVVPYQCKMTLKNSSGKIIKAVEASGFCTFMSLTPEKGQVYELDLSNGNSGVCLHGKGFPLVMCPDVETARRIHGGAEADGKGRLTFHECIRSLNRWCDSLTKKDLEVDVKLTKPQKKIVLKGKFHIGSIKIKLGDVAKIIAAQNIDQASKDFGQVKKIVRGRDNIDYLALAAGEDNPDNPYYGNPALIRRVLLGKMSRIRKFDASFRFEAMDDNFKKTDKLENYFQTPTRSNWYGLGLDSKFASAMLLIDKVSSKGLPAKVISAYKQSLRLWAMGRINMHVGEVANQWGWNYFQVMSIAELLKDKELELALKRNAKLVSTPNLYGRLNPDETPFDRKTGRLDTDCGLTSSGYMPEQMGFDGEYSCEQTMLWGKIWAKTQQQCIVDWFNKFNQLKTYVTISKTEDAPKVTFSQTCSPTDLNFRTRYMTHKNHQPKEMVGQVEFLDLWFPKKGVKSAEPWPFLKTKPFTKVIDNKYFFINTSRYYAILYGGPRLPLWADWSAATFTGDSVNFDGYSGPGYGGWGIGANKPGGISAIYVKGCGPISLGQNNTVMDSNTVWGKAFKPLYKAWRKQDVDPTVFASCYARSEVEFNAEQHKYVITELIPYVPLAVRRVMKFNDNEISVEVEIKALEDFKGKALNYSIPFFADKREVTLTGDKISTKVNLKPVNTPTRPRYPNAKLEHSRMGRKLYNASILSVTSKNGHGAEYIFDKSYDFRILQPFRYRSVAPAGGSFIMLLPKTLKKDETVKFSYIVKIK